MGSSRYLDEETVQRAYADSAWIAEPNYSKNASLGASGTLNTPKESVGLDALEGTAGSLHDSMSRLESKIDILQSRLGLPSIYDVPTKSAVTSEPPQNRLHSILLIVQSLGRRIETAANNLDGFASNL